MKPYKFILYNETLGQKEVTDPKGWEDTEFTKIKSDRYWALEYNITGKYEFIKDGKEYLEQAFELNGIETKVFFQVRFYLKSQKKYKSLFTGLVDFESKVISKTGYNVQIEQLDLARKFLNRDEEEVNLQELVTLDDTAITPYANELVTIPMHSKTIKREYEGFVSEAKAFQLWEATVIQSGTIQQLYSLEPQINDLDVSGFNIDTSAINEFVFTPGFSTTFDFTIDVENDKLYIFQATEKGLYTININFDFYLFLDNPSPTTDACLFILRIVVVNPENGTRKEYVPYSQFLDTLTLETITFNNFNGNEQTANLYRTALQQINDFYQVNIIEGDEVYIYTELKFSAPTNNDVFTVIEVQNNTSINIEGLTIFEETECQGMLAHEYFDRLITKLTGTEGRFKSNLLGRIDSEPQTYDIDGEGSMIFFTNGYKIRELNDRPLFVSFWDAFQTIDSIYNCALGIEVENGKQILRLEKKDYFYNRSKLIISQKPVYTIEVAKEFIFNSFEIGYKEWKNESKNNLDEFNTKHVYSLPVTRIKKKESKLARHVAAGYSIEESRRMKYKITEDNDNDQENFVIKVVRTETGYRPQKADNFQSIENVIDSNTVYNADISPKRNLLRWQKYLNIPCYLQTGKKIKFTYGEGNYFMQSTKSGILVDEDGDINVNDLDARYFRPERYKIDEPVKITDDDLLKIINNNSLVLEFIGYENSTIFAIVESIRVKPHDKTFEADLLEITKDIASEIVIPDAADDTEAGLDSELDFEVS